MVYDRSMKMDGPCAVNRCMTDGKLENVEGFFLFFDPSRTFTCWGYVYFLIFVESITICLINVLKSRINHFYQSLNQI